MSQENVNLVKRAVDAFNRRDLAVLEEVSHPDLEFVSVLTAVDGESTYRGTETWSNYFDVMNQMWEEWRVDDFEVHDGGDDRLAAVFHLVGRGKASGVPVERAVGIAYRIRDEKIWRARSYLEPSEALEAAGLSK